jgi:hypothetical protein
MTAVTGNTEYDVAVAGGAAGGMAETTWLEATAQADLVRRGVSPKELAEAAIARIEAVNSQLDAMIRTRFDAARQDAAGWPGPAADADAAGICAGLIDPDGGLGRASSGGVSPLGYGLIFEKLNVCGRM